MNYNIFYGNNYWLRLQVQSIVNTFYPSNFYLQMSRHYAERNKINHDRKQNFWTVSEFWNNKNTIRIYIMRRQRNGWPGKIGTTAIYCCILFVSRFLIFSAFGFLLATEEKTIICGNYYRAAMTNNVVHNRRQLIRAFPRYPRRFQKLRAIIFNPKSRTSIRLICALLFTGSHCAVDWSGLRAHRLLPNHRLYFIQV